MQYLIGTTVGLTATKSGRLTKYEITSQADKDNLLALWPTVRIWLPGVVGTTDFRSDRLNVGISAEGVIERIYYG